MVVAVNEFKEWYRNSHKMNWCCDSMRRKNHSWYAI